MGASAEEELIVPAVPVLACALAVDVETESGFVKLYD